MEASENQAPRGDPHRVTLRAAYEGTIGDPYGVQSPAGADRLLLMVTAVLDRLTAVDESAPEADA